MNSARKILSTFLSWLIFMGAGAIVADFSSARAAEEGWIEYTSPTNQFSTLIPEKHREKTSVLVLDKQRGFLSTELLGTIDQRPYKNVVKNYIMRTQHTLGPPLSADELKTIITKELDFIEDQYLPLQGTRLKREEKDLTTTLPKGEMHLTYVDPTLGPQALRILVTFSDISKYYQIVTGPPDVAFSPQTQHFFQYSRVNPSFYVLNEDERKPWEGVVSPTNLYTVFLPPAAAPYFEDAPIIKKSGNSEFVGSVFYDPVRRQKLFFNVYGYKFEKELSFDEAYKIVASKHVSKYLKSAEGVTIRKRLDGDFASIIVEFVMPGLKGYPYVQYAQTEANFVGHYMIVKEVLSSTSFNNSVFVDNLIKRTAFHPKKYNAKGAAPTAPPSETPASAEPAAPETVPETASP